MLFAFFLGRVPGQGTEHPWRFALAPGGFSGAVPTTMVIGAGSTMTTPTDAGTLLAMRRRGPASAAPSWAIESSATATAKISTSFCRLDLAVGVRHQTHFLETSAILSGPSPMVYS